MLRYNVAAWTDILVEIQPLLKRHWEEVALDREQVKLDVDHLRYAQLDAEGALALVAARDPEQDHRLVGYIAAIISTHLHYKSTVFGLFDVFYLDPEYRVGRNGMFLFLEMEKELKRRGVKKMVGQTKLSLNVSPVFEFLGWTEVERVFTKVI